MGVFIEKQQAEGTVGIVIGVEGAPLPFRAGLAVAGHQHGHLEAVDEIVVNVVAHVGHAVQVDVRDTGERLLHQFLGNLAHAVFVLLHGEGHGLPVSGSRDVEIRSTAGKAHAASAQHTGQDEDDDRCQQNHRGGNSKSFFPPFPGFGCRRSGRFFGRSRNGSGFRAAYQAAIRQQACRRPQPAAREGPCPFAGAAAPAVLRVPCRGLVPAQAALPLGQLLPGGLPAGFHSGRASAGEGLPPGPAGPLPQPGRRCTRRSPSAVARLATSSRRQPQRWHTSSRSWFTPPQAQYHRPCPLQKA